MSLDKLEKKVEEKTVTKVDDVVSFEEVGILKLNSQIDAVYRLVNNVTRRMERKLDSLQYIEDKQNLIIKLLENKGVNVEEIQKQEEIKELEQKLKQLKGEV